jgi:hypothetical protein
MRGVTSGSGRIKEYAIRLLIRLGETRDIKKAKRKYHAGNGSGALL